MALIKLKGNFSQGARGVAWDFDEEIIPLHSVLIKYTAAVTVDCYAEAWGVCKAGVINFQQEGVCVRRLKMG